MLVLDTIKSEPKYNHCIIFDDRNIYLKHYEIRKLLKEVIFNRRYSHISIYFWC
jgi:hypothetical protein